MVKGAKIKRNAERVSAVSDDAIRLLVENSMALQKVMADMAVTIKKLSKEVSEMLELFKEASKTLAAEKAEEQVKEEEIAELKNKLDMLLEQNKTIASGILLLESIIKPKQYSPNYPGM